MGMNPYTSMQTALVRPTPDFGIKLANRRTLRQDLAALDDPPQLRKVLLDIRLGRWLPILALGLGAREFVVLCQLGWEFRAGVFRGSHVSESRCVAVAR